MYLVMGRYALLSLSTFTVRSLHCRTPAIVSTYTTPSMPQPTQQKRNTRSDVRDDSISSDQQEIKDEMWKKEVAELFSLSNLPAREGTAANSARLGSSQHYSLCVILTGLLSLLLILM